MEAALWQFVEALAPEVARKDIRVTKAALGVLELAGRISIEHATRFNIAVHRFLWTSRHDFGLVGKVNAKGLDVYVPRVRLGDVTTERERQILALHTENDSYRDPETLVDAPEWNPDFVRASDRRHEAHIKPRYGRDDDATLDAAAAFIADFCKEGKGIVVHSGAGLSAAAGIATYREGSSESVAISAAMPTFSHFAIVALNKLGYVDYVCSQNVDGLHRRSGLPAASLSELHGNSYIETCSCCCPRREFIRPYDVYSTGCSEPKYWARSVRTPEGGRKIEANTALTKNEQSSGIPHITGAACPGGGGPLRDSIIHFGESLPIRALEEGERRSAQAPLNLVVGCSLLVRPAAGLPFEAKGPVAIVSLSCTGSDRRALRRGGILLHAPVDAVMDRIMRQLGIDFRDSAQLMERLHQRVQERDRAVLKSDDNCPYDGDADGGVVPVSMLRKSGPTPSPLSSMAAVGGAVTQSRLLLRQTHEPADDNWHRWSLSLESSGGSEAWLKNVQMVRFKLHPTFNPPEHCVSEPPFRIGPLVGWGTFDVIVQVERPGQPVWQTRFPLDFSQPEKVELLDIRA